MFRTQTHGYIYTACTRVCVCVWERLKRLPTVFGKNTRRKIWYTQHQSHPKPLSDITLNTRMSSLTYNINPLYPELTRDSSQHKTEEMCRSGFTSQSTSVYITYITTFGTIKIFNTILTFSAVKCIMRKFLKIISNCIKYVIHLL